LKPGCGETTWKYVYPFWTTTIYIYMYILYDYICIVICIYIYIYYDIHSTPSLGFCIFLVFTGFCDWFTWLEFFRSFERGYHIYIILYIVIVWWGQILVWLDL
jgi:hypothetical protein